ncbi:MAG TPA: protein kinase [Bacteroidota bacterium]|nr:protein kinase [Bacteroidota bacterium]
MIGQVVSHYDILEKLGEGGMGVVYKAQDTKLDRIVALKFLPHQLTPDESDKARFLQEAKAAAALNHNNICTVHDIDETSEGQMFIVMDFYEGETLKKKIERGPLKIDDAIEIATQVAQGLAKAHEHGIVHRDIKPANVMITSDGVAKIVDFGLAKLSSRTMLTKTGLTLGTAAYMSPEQAKGEETDSRTDIWSLGVVLYEMLSGRRPFAAEYENALLYSVINSEPEHLTGLRTGVSMDLERIVRKCMAKPLGNRYQHIEEILVDLRSVQQETPTPGQAKRKARNIPLLVGGATVIVAFALFAYLFVLPKAFPSGAQSVAVLPFLDLSPQKDQEYFCDGITEDLVNRLGNVEGLRVPARTSVFTFKGKPFDVKEVGDKLNVQTVLEGSVQKSGDRLRITAQLINVADGYHLWSEKYDREMKNIFDIQDEISTAIVAALRLKLTSNQMERALTHPVTSVTAYELYLKARYLRFFEVPDSIERAISYYKLAVEEEPGFALGWAGLSEAYILKDWSGSWPSCHAVSRAAGENALRLDSSLAEAHIAFALVQYGYELDWSGAERSLRRAVELSPNGWNAHRELGLLLFRTGRTRDAIGELKEALELGPLSWQSYRDLGCAYIETGDHLLAKEMLQSAIALNPRTRIPLFEFIGSEYDYLAWEDIRTASYPEARDLLQKTDSIAQVLVDVVRGEKGRIGLGIAALHKARVDPLSKSIILARVYSLAGQRDSALSCLEAVSPADRWGLGYSFSDPYFSSLTSEPRFTSLEEKCGWIPNRDSTHRGSQ